MTKGILDIEIGTEDKKKPSILNWASIIILWIGIGLCVASGMIGNLKLIIAIALLAATTIFTYINFEKGVKTTMFVILVGVLGFIEFFPFKYEFSFGIGGLGIGFEFVLIGVAILHYFMNRENLKEPEKEISEEEKETKFNKRKTTFKHHFSGRGIDELKRLVEEGKIVAPAIAAAKELIEEKENKKKAEANIVLLSMPPIRRHVSSTGRLASIKQKNNMVEVISIIGSIASIIGLLLYLLEKKGIVSVKIPMKVVIFIVLITAILIAISLARNTTSVEIKQNENNDHNKIEVITD